MSHSRWGIQNHTPNEHVNSLGGINKITPQINMSQPRSGEQKKCQKSRWGEQNHPPNKHVTA